MQPNRNRPAGFPQEPASEKKMGGSAAFGKCLKPLSVNLFSACRADLRAAGE
jgi:hypothetical protein